MITLVIMGQHHNFPNEEPVGQPHSIYYSQESTLELSSLGFGKPYEEFVTRFRGV